ncbi:hypothetical protein JOD45_002400 [Scopulibacillus daqui]|uniref:Uncharacterized protein n=1 Tax=Scopulibacillus daqui TaxID=1469162 RepID=A0ABS2Q3B9_9BACL|nr:hypothetical protein [Scopulibacillus daqui]
MLLLILPLLKEAKMKVTNNKKVVDIRLRV